MLFNRKQVECWKMNDFCDYCGQINNLEHFFYYCPATISFLDEIHIWPSNFVTCNIKLTVLEVLFGLIILQPHIYNLVNYILFVAKSYVCSCKKKNKDLILKLVSERIKRIKIET